MPRRWRYFEIAWFVNYALKTGMEGVVLMRIEKQESSPPFYF
jgi:hypothetical protein